MTVRTEPEDNQNISELKTLLAKSEGVEEKDITKSLVIKFALQQTNQIGVLKSNEIEEFVNRNDPLAKVVNRRINRIISFGDGHYFPKENDKVGTLKNNKTTVNLKKNNDIKYDSSRISERRWR
ncbi:hypothetical protein ACFL96_12710 [Thermoproteota archaeon]